MASSFITLLFYHFEKEKASWPLQCSSCAVKTACDMGLMEGVGLAQDGVEEIEDACLLDGSSQQSTLKKGTLGNQVCNLLCMQLATDVNDVLTPAH